jgi:hypothetical protein
VKFAQEKSFGAVARQLKQKPQNGLIITKPGPPASRATRVHDDSPMKNNQKKSKRLSDEVANLNPCYFFSINPRPHH